MEKHGRKSKKVQYKEANLQITGTLKRINRKNREEKLINKTILISLLEPMNFNFQIKRAKYIQRVETDSQGCTLETSIILYINYTSVLKNKRHTPRDVKFQNTEERFNNFPEE